ncbi:MFS transporter [Cellulosimicrobium cellulans]|uniref:MFS transporter n=1 Tax=Cellulosimicrobium cellulans TaxID=1710 RepID=UPI001652640E|nr:MFS transporter [Cellulosimicrobium cellulans]
MPDDAQSAPAEPGPLRHPPFRWFLGSTAAEAVSDSVVKGVLPILAVSTLGAGATAAGAINAASLVAFLLISVPVGAWIDRRCRTRVMVWSAMMRACVVLAVPLLYAVDRLTVGAVLAVAAAVGVADVFFTNSSAAVLPAIVGRDQVTEAYARRQSVGTGISILSPVLTSVVLRVLSAPLSMVVASTSYVCSALALRRVPEPPRDGGPVPRGRGAFGREVRQGLGFVARHRVVRAVVLATATLNSAAMFGAGAEAVFALNELGVCAATLVATQAVGALGGFLASVVAVPVVRRAGIAGTFVASCALGASAVVVLPASPALGIPPVVGVAVATFGWSFSVICASVAQAGIIPRVTPQDLLGRVMSNTQFVTLGSMPLAALAGGLLADRTSASVALYAWGALAVLAVVPVLCSPIRSWRVLPTTAEAT